MNVVILKKWKIYPLLWIVNYNARNVPTPVSFGLINIPQTKNVGFKMEMLPQLLQSVIHLILLHGDLEFVKVNRHTNVNNACVISRPLVNSRSI